MSMFDRLALYAPWTTSIYVMFGETSQCPPSSESVDALRAVLGFMSTRIMFPRLRDLVINIHNYEASHLPGATWLFLLVSPSITRFQLALDHEVDGPEISMYIRVIEVFSGIVLNTCSELEELELYCPPRTFGDVERKSPASWCYIPSQPHLSVLHLSSHLFDKNSFQWISQLSRLQRLEIEGKSTSANLRENLGSNLAPNAFPVLSDIRLCDVTFDLFVALWQPTVVLRLTRTALLWSEPIISNQDVPAIVGMIATHAPKLASLMLRPCLLDGYSPLPLQMLSSLPLVCLDLEYLHGYELDFSSDIGAFGTSWPRLGDLSLSDFEISYPELLRVSMTLPNLRKLRINLPEYPPDVETDVPSHPLPSEWPCHEFRLSPCEVACGGWGFETDGLENLGL
ncbi:hypothetical protein FRC10_008662 [Ceratobasidium sp. 414]|nr:hypothetical protein FRC10_008662 [Ceratobasidium sp. 414]